VVIVLRNVIIITDPNVFWIEGFQKPYFIFSS